jgi:hypothetical protein
MNEDTIVERVPHKAQLEKGVYDAVIMRVEVQKDVNTNYGIKDMFVLTFGIGDVEVRRRYNKSWTPSSYIYKLVAELRPDETLGLSYDVAKLEGTKVRVLISHNKTESGDVWDNVMEVELPPKAKPIEKEPMATKAARSFEDDANDQDLTKDGSSFKVTRGPDPEGENE